MNAGQMYQSSHARWSAVSQRDPAAHCSFIYGVKTTKIYCRPTCTARLARRANVVYYDNIEQAQRDGFRACQRCKPDDAAFLGQREEVVLSALGLLRTSQDDAAMKWSLKELAKKLNVTPSYLCRVFKKTMGTTIGEYMRQFDVQASETTTGGTSQSSDTTGPSTASSGVQPVTPEAMPMQPLDDAALLSTGWGIPANHTATHGLERPLKTTDSSTYFADPVAAPQKCAEEAVDLNFDFDEWVWTEGLNFNEWTSGAYTSNGNTTC